MLRLLIIFLGTLSLATTALGAAPTGEEETGAVVTNKTMVKDPATGTMVTAPEYRGSIRSPIDRSPLHSDPQIHWSGALLVSGVLEKLGLADWRVSRITSKLTKPGTVSEFVLNGLLVVRWDISDNKTILLEICSTVHWQDKEPMYGRQFTAYDVEYTFHRVYGLGSGYQEHTGGADHVLVTLLQSVTASDDRTVVIELNGQAFRALPAIFDHWSHFVVPPEIIEEYGDLRDWRNLVGTGPFVLDDYVEGSHISWTKNTDYWGFDEKYPKNKLPYVDKIVAPIIEDPAARMAALKAGTIDIIGYGGFADIRSVSDVDSLKETNPELLIWPWPMSPNNAYIFETTKAPFDDVRLRTAMQMALNHQSINDDLYGGYGFPYPIGLVEVDGLSDAFDELAEELKQQYSYVPKEANRILDDAGYPRGTDGTRFPVRALVTRSVDRDYQSSAVASLEEVGVDLEIQEVGRTEFGRRVASHDYGEMFGSVTGYNAIRALELLSSPGWPGNEDPKYNNLVDEVREAATTEEQRAAIEAANRYVLEQHWLLWGTRAPSFNVSQPWLKGYNGENGLGTFDWNALLARLWIDRELKEEMGY